MAKSLSFWDRAHIYTPPLVRMMARKNGQPMDFMDLCDKSVVLDPVTVETVTKSPSWDGVHFETMREFLAAAGMDFCDWPSMHRADEYIRNGPTFIHLRRAPDWKTYWLPLMIRWRKGYGIVSKTSPVWPPLRELLMKTNLILR